MNQTIRIAWVLLFLFLLHFQLSAEGWIRNKKKMLVSRGLGLSQIFILPSKLSPGIASSPIGVSLNFSTEHKVKRCVGIGIQTGLNIFLKMNFNAEQKNIELNTSYAIPVGGRILFHLLEALYVPGYCRYDVYCGIQAGGGPVFEQGKKMQWFAYAGPVTGVRYRFNKISLFGEFGYGANFFNCGVTF
ncbi:MAG: hypothetical protein NTY88_14680 [Bacteroidetes bacterium]|nr:hypothetical protein [Bacteroidota bacterium]